MRQQQIIYFHPKFPRLYGIGQPKGRGTGETGRGKDTPTRQGRLADSPVYALDNKVLSVESGIVLLRIVTLAGKIYMVTTILLPGGRSTIHSIHLQGVLHTIYNIHKSSAA